TVRGSPTVAMAALKPSAIDSTPRKTTTTPAMPMIATVDDPSRWRIERRLTPVTAMICESMTLVPPQGVHDAEPPGLPGGHGARREPEGDHDHNADDEIARGWTEPWCAPSRAAS